MLSLLRHWGLVLDYRILKSILLYVIFITVIGVAQSVLLRVLIFGIHASIPILIFFSITSINMLASLLLFLSSHMIFNVILPAHLDRCTAIYTADCGLSELMNSNKMIVAVIILPFLLLSLIIGSAVKLGLPPTPNIITGALVYSIAKVYGIPELTGYTFAFIAPLQKARGKRVLITVLALTSIIIGAYIETIILLK